MLALFNAFVFVKCSELITENSANDDEKDENESLNDDLEKGKIYDNV